MEKTKNYYKEKAQRIIEYANILSKKFITKEKTEEEKILENLKRPRKNGKTRRYIFNR